MYELIFIFAGTLYGLLIGIIPSIGATTGLIFLFSFISYVDPYLAVIFCMACVAASATGDSYSGVLLGIPGANSCSTIIIDGHALAKKGYADYAISSAITSSSINGIFWGLVTFLFFPYYTNVIYFFGIPEIWAFTLWAFSAIVFIGSKWWIRGLLALILGIFLGLVGVDPTTNEARYTFGWFYLEDGIQILPLVAGLFAIPEMISYRHPTKSNISNQTLDGIKVVFQNKWIAIKGGIIGAFVGVLPGLGGAIADWIAYSQTVATVKEKFGQGNIKGVIGAEGANNAQKATSMLPTILFGIPGAPYAAILLSLFAYIGFEMGTPDLMLDQHFFDNMLYGFVGGTILVGVICFFITKHVAKLLTVPQYYYIPIILLIIIFSCVQYTGGWEDYTFLFLCGILGIVCKKFKFSRPCVLFGFILSERIELLTVQLTSIYSVDLLLDRWLFILLLLFVIITIFYGVFKSQKLEFV